MDAPVVPVVGLVRAARVGARVQRLTAGAAVTAGGPLVQLHFDELTRLTRISH